MLARALPYMPAGVHLAVVDPEVGARRRAVALRTGERLLVGPDNGLLIAAAERFDGVGRGVEISASPWRLEPVSATFHGRDVFAPVAARLASGRRSAGTQLDPAGPSRLRSSARQEEDDALVAHVRGRLVRQRDPRRGATATSSSAGCARPVAAAPTPRVRGVWRARSATYGGGLLVYEDAGGALALAVNGGNAALLLGLRARRRGAPGACVSSAVRACTCARSARPTTARANWPRRARRTGRWSRPRCRPPGAGGRAGRGRRRPGARCGVADPAGVDGLLPLRAGLAVADVAGDAAEVKWPNDVLSAGARSPGSSPRRGRRLGRRRHRRQRHVDSARGRGHRRRGTRESSRPR